MEQQDLTLVGLTDDRTHLVLVSDSGTEFRLAADNKLRAALRGDHARLGQLEITMESALRPRDIQARIRAGETPESVAAAASTSLERIMGYATPVLAERAHIAERAQRASVRRKAGEGSSRLLGDAVAAHLRAQNVDPETVAWDSWRREDGRWTLVADYRLNGSGQHAEFVFDAAGRYVVPEDDDARRLVGEQVDAAPPAAPQATSSPAAAGGATGQQRRLSAVPSDDQLPLGEDALGMVRDEPAAAAPDERPESVHTDQADWIATQASERPAPRKPRDELIPEPEPEPEAEEEQPAEPKKKGRRGRASVPSWDEIMFGGGKGD
ncbi:septation protein SepH [Nocardioides iriomotensis]|uniref:DUF3071 domain-containing protein n=1 Tax=Nocardioides iriomotensis TaxID=715784 RepID=A0A4Q5J0C4_9ACTN|nr:septation protein SepH [Nocardioides iriomotensis]RYU11960.1 DUF3071 domain-containing protein [Nocardioides iriomotensis]